MSDALVELDGRLFKDAFDVSAPFQSAIYTSIAGGIGVAGHEVAFFAYLEHPSASSPDAQVLVV